MVSQGEMEVIIENTGWTISKVFVGAAGIYTALTEKVV
jgi:hypothetical protein